MWTDRARGGQWGSADAVGARVRDAVLVGGRQQSSEGRQRAAQVRPTQVVADAAEGAEGRRGVAAVGAGLGAAAPLQVRWRRDDVDKFWARAWRVPQGGAGVGREAPRQSVVVEDAVRTQVDQVAGQLTPNAVTLYSKNDKINFIWKLAKL